jgi:hypothetical protein
MPAARPRTNFLHISRQVGLSSHDAAPCPYLFVDFRLSDRKSVVMRGGMGSRPCVRPPRYHPGAFGAVFEDSPYRSVAPKPSFVVPPALDGDPTAFPRMGPLAGR